MYRKSENSSTASCRMQFRFLVAPFLCLIIMGAAIVVIPIVSGAGSPSRSKSAPPSGTAPAKATAAAAFLPAPETTVIQGTYDPNTFPCASPRHHFTVGAGNARIVVQINAQVPTNDLSVTLLFGSDPNPVPLTTEDEGTCCEALLYEPAGGVPAGEYQVQVCQTPNTNGVPQNSPFDYTGTFTTDDTAGSGGTAPTYGAIPPAAQDKGSRVGFENFAAPGVLTPVTTTSAGLQVKSVEYMGRNAGEPSIGNNWKSGATVFYSDLETLFVTFNDTCPSNGQSSTWVNRPAPTSQAIDSDPIGFTDNQTGRSFAGELTLLSPSCKTSYTDDDGATWVPTQGSGIASGVDHQTIGGGPFAPPMTRPTNVPGLYPNAVYYCSQEGLPDSGPPSFCSRSDDGGLTFGPSVPLTSPAINVCGGLHGHVKVSPVDGAVYVPFNTCGGVGSLVASLDNGVTWTVRHVQTDTIQMKPSPSFQDPAIGIDRNGRMYYLIANDDSAAAVLTSDDHGETWQNLGDVGAVYGLKNIRYPAAVAGDAGRAAVAFYGTTTAGDALQPTFNGIWHLYVASTFDGGRTWTTTDATPGAPIQRGCIWAKGGANICRNLLDFFDMTLDREGRVLIGYVNGCEGGNCAQASAAAKGNAYTTAATIARQSSGRRLLAAYDPTASSTRPGVPSLNTRRIGRVTHLSWSEADTGNSPITSYKIFRGTASGAETLLATVSGTQTTYDDTSANDVSKTYFYKVLAVNAMGTSCGTNEVVAPYIGDTCSGVIIHQNAPDHPEANAGTNTPASLLIDYIAVGEPAGTDNFMFRMKVNDLSSVPANSRWRIVWNSFAAQAIGQDDAAQQFYVGMTTGPSGPPTFEYGTLADAGVPAVFVISETKQGDALPGSNFAPDGTITIIAPKSAFGSPQPGDLLGAVNGRTITADTSETNTLERSNVFIDHTFVKAQTDNSYPAATYMVVGNTDCAQPPSCLDDDDSRIAYSNGWHLINYSSASGGHFRYHEGSSPQHFANLDFTVPTGSTGAITYSFAKSPKGGKADIYLDGVFKQTVNFAGSVGSTQAPEFKPEYNVQFNNLSAGAHKLEIKNVSGVVYVDGFCLQNSGSNAQPANGPGNTTNQSSAVSAGQTSTSGLTMPAGSQEVSVVAESSLSVPYKLVLVNPSGIALQTVDATNGVAVLNSSVTQSGAYLIKVVNVSLGSLQFTVTATPLVKR